MRCAASMGYKPLVSHRGCPYEGNGHDCHVFCYTHMDFSDVDRGLPARVTWANLIPNEQEQFLRIGYLLVETIVPLGPDFEPGVEYTVTVNSDTTKTLVAQ